MGGRWLYYHICVWAGGWNTTIRLMFVIRYIFCFRYYPVILTGDLNLKPRNGVYKLLTEGQIMYEGMSRRNLNPTDDNNILPKVLIPSRLGITDQCQHIEVLDARNQGKTPPPSKNVSLECCNPKPRVLYGKVILLNVNHVTNKNRQIWKSCCK